MVVVLRSPFDFAYGRLSQPSQPSSLYYPATVHLSPSSWDDPAGHVNPAFGPPRCYIAAVRALLLRRSKRLGVPLFNARFTSRKFAAHKVYVFHGNDYENMAQVLSLSQISYHRGGGGGGLPPLTITPGSARLLNTNKTTALGLNP
ncbi:hypothetical protein M0804_003410 [Polistes exclamans]|nr:hypothetical protein M0804_003410 [Polistes exclamans]